MDLTSEALLEYIQQARLYARKARNERRKNPRVATAMTAKIFVRGGNALCEVSVSNVSQTGVCFITDTVLPVGQEFAMRLTARGTVMQWVCGRVVRWSDLAGGMGQVGAQFCEFITTDKGKMPLLVTPAVPLADDFSNAESFFTSISRKGTTSADASSGSAKDAGGDQEKRGARRVTVNVSSTASVIKDDGRIERLLVIIQNISTRGFGVRSRTPIPVGARVAFTIPFPHPREPKTILSRIVRNVAVSKDHYSIGAEMLDSREASQMGKTLPQEWLKQPAAAAK